MNETDMDEAQVEYPIEFRSVQAADITDLGAFIAELDAKKPTVIVAPDGTRAYVLSEAAHERLLDKFEDLEDSLAFRIAREENEPTTPLEEILREHMPERFTHVSD